MHIHLKLELYFLNLKLRFSDPLSMQKRPFRYIILRLEWIIQTKFGRKNICFHLHKIFIAFVFIYSRSTFYPIFVFASKSTIFEEKNIGISIFLIDMIFKKKKLKKAILIEFVFLPISYKLLQSTTWILISLFL